jgi:plastocyanin
MAKVTGLPLVLSVVTYVTILSLFLMAFGIMNVSFATVQTDTSASIDQVPNINATSIFDTHQMVLGNNFKNLVILIPNKGHHGPQVDEDRFLDQPFIPQNAVVTKGTNIVWLNDDVGHDHNLVVTNNSTARTVHETGVFPQFEVRNIALNETGNYHYTDIENYEEGFVMSGNIQVVDQSQSSSSTLSPPSTMSLSGNIQNSADTVGVLMVPTQDIQTYTTDLENRGFTIDSTHNFKDLRGGQSGTGDEQTLIVWTTIGMDMSNMATNLQEFSS